MRRFVVVALLAVVLAVALTGCGTLNDQKVQFLQASDSYQTTTAALVMFRQLGKIDDKAWAEVKEWDNAAYHGLQVWQESLMAGRPSTEAALEVNRAMREMLLLRLKLSGGV